MNLFNFGTQIKDEEARELKRMFNNDPIHRSALDIIRTCLLSQGIVVKSKKEISEDGFNIEDYIQKTFKNAVIDALKDHCIYGYCVWYTVKEKHPEFNNRILEIPYILPREYYSVTIEYQDNLKPVVTVKLTKFDYTDSLEKKLNIFFMEGYKPDFNTGEHYSIIKPSLKHSKWINDRFKDFALACKQMSHPPFSIETKDFVKDEDLIHFAGQQMQKIRSNAQEKRDQGNLDKYNQIAAYNKSNFDQNRADDFVMDIHSDGQDREYTPTTVDNTHLLVPPFVASSTQAPIPQTQSDLLQYEANRREDVLSLWGIPASFILSGSQNNSMSNTNNIDDHDYQNFTRNLKNYQRNMVIFIEEIYKTVFNKRGSKMDIEVDIPIIPFTTSHALYTMEDMDVISTDTRNKYLMLINGLKLEDITKKRNKHDRPIPGQNPDFTDPLIQAKKRKMEAGAYLEEEKAKAVSEEIKIQKEGLEIQREGVENKIIEERKESSSSGGGEGNAKKSVNGNKIDKGKQNKVIKSNKKSVKNKITQIKTGV